MRLTALFIVMAFSQFSWATLTVGTNECPVQFNGRAIEIIDDVGPSSSYSTSKVIFADTQALKGEVKDKMIVEVLKHGPIQIVPGEDYQVQLRNGFVCGIEHL